MADLERLLLEAIDEAWARQGAGTRGVGLVAVP
jgi:hypothetical protein